MMAGSELPVDFVSGTMLAFIPEEGGTEALEDMLALLEDILELLPVLGCGAASWPWWKFATTGECILEHCEEWVCDGGYSIELAARSDTGLIIERSDVGLLTADLSAALLSVAFAPPLTMSLIPPTEVLKRLYSPLRPPCSSSDSRFSSEGGAGAGGLVNSLKSVSESDWYAAVWIWSRAAFMVSRSVCVVAKEPLDPRRPSGRNADDAEGLDVPCDFCSMVLACCGQARSSFDDPHHTGDGCF